MLLKPHVDSLPPPLILLLTAVWGGERACCEVTPALPPRENWLSPRFLLVSPSFWCTTSCPVLFLHLYISSTQASCFFSSPFLSFPGPQLFCLSCHLSASPNFSVLSSFFSFLSFLPLLTSPLSMVLASVGMHRAPDFPSDRTFSCVNTFSCTANTATRGSTKDSYLCFSPLNVSD